MVRRRPSLTHKKKHHHRSHPRSAKETTESSPTKDPQPADLTQLDTEATRQQQQQQQQQEEEENLPCYEEHQSESESEDESEDEKEDEVEPQPQEQQEAEPAVRPQDKPEQEQEPEEQHEPQDQAMDEQQGVEPAVQPQEQHEPQDQAMDEQQGVEPAVQPQERHEPQDQAMDEQQEVEEVEAQAQPPPRRVTFQDAPCAEKTTVQPIAHKTLPAQKTPVPVAHDKAPQRAGKQPCILPPPPRRHRKVLRDTINDISKSSIRKLAKRGGVKRINGFVPNEARRCLAEFVSNVVKDAIAYTEHARRKTVTVCDITNALKLRNKTLYM